MEETAVSPRGTVFHPELIELMKVVLEDATATLPEAKRTPTIKTEIASRILACAAKGERDPITLKMAALSAMAERMDQPHDVSPERRGRYELQGTLAMEHRDHRRAEELKSLGLALATFALRLDAFEARFRGGPAKMGAEPTELIAPVSQAAAPYSKNDTQYDDVEN
jgi:hypothetical protein